jgi:hypothetical protein
VEQDVEKAVAGEGEGDMGMKRVEGLFCDCKRRGYCDWGSWWEGGGVLGEKRRFKSKALDLLCSVCTGCVVKPEAGGFYPNKE